MEQNTPEYINNTNTWKYQIFCGLKYGAFFKFNATTMCKRVQRPHSEWIYWKGHFLLCLKVIFKLFRFRMRLTEKYIRWWRHEWKEWILCLGLLWKYDGSFHLWCSVLQSYSLSYLYLLKVQDAGIRVQSTSKANKIFLVLMFHDSRKSWKVF